jgi:hypothetical protein
VRIVVASYDDRNSSSPAAPGKADAE